MHETDTSHEDNAVPASDRIDANDRGPDSHRFKLHPVVVALVVLYFLLHIGGTVGVAIWRERMDLIEGLFGGVLFGAFLIGVPSWLAWRVTRSKLVGNIVCSLIVVLLFVSFGSLILNANARVEKNETAMNTFIAESDADRQRQADYLERAIAGEVVGDEMQEQFDKTLERAEKVTAESSGMQAKVMDAMTQVMRRLQAPLAKYNEAASLFMGAGGIDPGTLTESESLAERLTLAESFKQANDELSAVYADLERDMRDRLTALNLKEREVDHFVGEWMKGARPDLMARVRESDRVIAERSCDMIRLLSEHHGAWSYSDDMILFDDPAALNLFDLYAREMDEAAVAQTEAQREIQQVILQQQQAVP